MATFVKFQQAVADAWNGQHNFGADVFKIALTNTAPVAASNVAITDITQITAANGYVAGGAVIGITSATQTAGVLSVVPTADVVFTASGGAFGPARYAVFYNSTSGRLISYWDKGASVTITDPDTLTIDVGATLFTAS